MSSCTLHYFAKTNGLAELLQLQSGKRFCEQVSVELGSLSIRKAFDAAWREGFLVRLWHAGLPPNLWLLDDDFISARTASVRVVAHVG